MIDFLYIYLLVILFLIPVQLKRLQNSGFYDLSEADQAKFILEFGAVVICLPIVVFFTIALLGFCSSERFEKIVKISMYLIIFTLFGIDTEEEPQDE